MSFLFFADLYVLLMSLLCYSQTSLRFLIVWNGTTSTWQVNDTDKSKQNFDLIFLFCFSFCDKRISKWKYLSWPWLVWLFPPTVFFTEFANDKKLKTKTKTPGNWHSCQSMLFWQNTIKRNKNGKFLEIWTWNIHKNKNWSKLKNQFLLSFS